MNSRRCVAQLSVIVTDFNTISPAGGTPLAADMAVSGRVKPRTPRHTRTAWSCNHAGGALSRW